MLFMNLAAPSLIKQDHLLASMNVLQYCLANDPRALGLVILPVWSYNKNGIWAEQDAVMKYLGAAQAHSDRSFFIQFLEKCVQSSDVFQCQQALYDCN